jgi:thiol-disulfide isomerase/thioredoxin
VNRIGLILAGTCGALAVLVAALSGAHALIHSKSVHAAMTELKAAARNTSNKVASGSQEDDDSGAVIRFAKNPEPIPLFMARDLDGNVISTAAYKGKVLIVNFWATWCPPCREEIPTLVKLQETYKDQMQILSISEDDSSPETVRAFARQTHINYPIVLVTREIEDDFGGVPALPTSFLISKDGGIVQKHVGFYPASVYDREIRALAGLPVDVKIETFEDTGQIFLKNAKNATELPGVDLSKLTPEQKQIALRRMNSESCTCGCKLTLAECRINDTACPISRQLAAKIVQEVLAGKPEPPPTKPSDGSSSD